MEQARSLPATWISNEVVGVITTHERVRSVIVDDNPIPFLLAHENAPVALAGAHGQTLEWF